MERPNKENYQVSYYDSPLATFKQYTDDLEKYCDELEMLIEDKKHRIPQLEGLEFVAQHSKYCPHYEECNGKLCVECVADYTLKAAGGE